MDKKTLQEELNKVNEHIKKVEIMFNQLMGQRFLLEEFLKKENEGNNK